MTSQSHIPHIRIVVATCVVAVAGYACFSTYAVLVLKDPAMIGDIIGTWKSFAVASFTFWLGSSSGGKEKRDTPAGTDADPTKTEIVNEPHNPANVKESAP